MRSFVMGCIVLLAMAGSAFCETKVPSKELALDLDGSVKLEMVLIPAGEFIMGDAKSGFDGEKPVHKVTLTKPFYLGKYEVTQGQWLAVMGGNNPCNFFKEPDLKKPVECVSWSDCQAFLDKLNSKAAGQGGKFVFPTEAQWEYACRAGSSTAYCFGDDEARLGDYAWYWANSDRKTHPAGEKKPNAWGLYDMHGNVWEWCADWCGPYGAEAATDPSGPTTGSFHVARGGGWDYGTGYCRSACRDDNTPRGRGYHLGFRVARVLDDKQPAQSTLTAQTPRAAFAAPANAASSFTVKFTVDLKKFNGKKCILNIPKVLSVFLRQHDPLDRNRQNYPAFKMPDGSVPVLEANVVLHSTEHPDWKSMTVGIPLALLKKPEGEHEIVLNFTGVRWTMFVDGELLDNDFPFGYPQWADKNTWKLDPEYVKLAAVYLPGIKPEKKQAKTPNTLSSIQYWLPSEHNNWVGDVATLSYKGRYHVFYLYDRRHHQSKFGCGAHYFEHISTEDFKTWTEHDAATPLEEQWECIGTGMPFVFNNELCISYGLHTTRVYPHEKTTLPAQWEYLNKNGRTGKFNRDTTLGMPAGATYAVSADGVSNFKKSNIMFHPCENPSVYTDPSGKLRMMANFHSNGIWESDSVNGGWHCISPGFPPGGDCTFFFRWGKFDYIIGGFTGLWSKPAASPDSAYEDIVRKGLDFYDGSNVPSITEIKGGRFLMAAWIPIRGWGGNLIIRELVQFPDGRIGSKWMKEITPETEKHKTLAAKVAETMTFPTNGKSFMLVFNVQPAEAKKGKFGISFLPENGEQTSRELQIRLDDMRSQFGPGSFDKFAGNEKSLREGGSPQQVGNYAIENLIGVDKPFTVRVIVKGCDKIGGSLIDAEIAGQRTMISYCPGLTVKKMVFRTAGVELKNMQIAPLKN